MTFCLLSKTEILLVLMLMRFWLLPIPLFIRYPFEIASICINIVWIYENAALDSGSVPSHNGSSSYSSSNRYGPGHCALSIPTHSLTRELVELVEILFTNILWFHSRSLDSISRTLLQCVYLCVHKKRNTKARFLLHLSNPYHNFKLNTTRKFIIKARCL